eukprot:g10136.t1
MPAYAPQRRGSRRGGSRAAVNPEDDSAMAIQREVTIQRQLGLAKGVPLSPTSSGTGSPTQFDPARAAMCLLKEEDHVWTIETCMETINLLRARNNALKAQLLEADTNFVDHVQARQRQIVELTESAEGNIAIKNQLEATLEAERGERRRQDRDQQRQREAENLAYEQTIKELTEEVEGLRVFSEDRNGTNAKLAELEAANAELRDQREIEMHSLRKKLAEIQAGKQEDVERLVLQAKENMRDEVELAVGGAYGRLVKDNQDLRDKLRQLDSKLQIVLSDLEHEVAAKAKLQMEVEILKSLENKSAGKIKYYMRMLKRSANELVHECENGGGGRMAAASGDDEGPTKDLRLCRSCGGAEKNGGGGGRRGRASSTNPVAGKRPGTAPAMIRRCSRGSGSARAPDGSNNAEARKEPVFANLTTTAADPPCDPCACHGGGGSGRPSSSSPGPVSSGCRCRGRATNGQSTARSRCATPRGVTRRRAQTAARARGDAASIDNTDTRNHANGCLAVGGVQKPSARRAQTAGRCRVQSDNAASGCHASAVAPPRHPGRTPRDGDGGRTECDVDRAADSGTRTDERDHASREGEAGKRVGDAEIPVAEEVTPCSRRQQAEGAPGEEEALLAKRSDPSTSTCEAKRLLPDDGSGGNSSGHRANDPGETGDSAAETGQAGDLPLEYGEERIGGETSTGTADGGAVQCWRDLDAYLEHRGRVGGSGGSGGGDATGTGGTGCRPGRPATSGGTRQRSPRRPSGSHRPTFPRQHHEKVGRKRKIPSNSHAYVDRPGAEHNSVEVDDAPRVRNGSGYQRGGGRRPWTAAPHLSSGARGGGRGDGGGGAQNWWDRLTGGDEKKRNGGEVRKEDVEVLGGKLWGDTDEDEDRKRELFETLRVAERDGARATNEDTNNEIVPGREHRIGRHRAHAAAAVGCEGEEERLISAVDNGDLDLLSPGGRLRQGADGCYTFSPRAARTRAALDSAGGEIKNRLQSTKPLQTVLIRERLGGVGNGSPTAPRQSEIDEVAAEEAAKAVATASITRIANTVAATRRKSLGSPVAPAGLPAAAAAAAAAAATAAEVAAKATAHQAAAGEGDGAVANKAVSRGSTQQHDNMMKLLASRRQLAPSGAGDEASGSTSCSLGNGYDGF